MSIPMTILLWIAYLVSLYFSIFWFIIFFNKEGFRLTFQSNPKLKKAPKVTVIIPAFNEDKNLRETLLSVLNIDYPHDKMQIIAVDDGSTDSTLREAKNVASEFKDRDISVLHQTNQGKAAALNNALNHTKGDFFACLDADSLVDPLTLKKQLKVFETTKKEVTIVTPAMKVYKPRNFLERLQSLEYFMAIFLARLMSHLDCLYVAPGPFSLYRTEKIIEIGGFDTDNLTEDQEIAYRVQSHHLKLKHCPGAFVYTKPPSTLKGFYAQRLRWLRGGLENAFKYRSLLMNRKYGDFGFIQMSINFVVFFLCTLVLVFFTRSILWPIMKGIHQLWLVGFDIWPYLKTMQFSFSLLNLNWEAMLIVNTMLLVSLITVYFSFKNAQEKVNARTLLHMVPYFLIYYILISFVAIMSVSHTVIRRDRKW